MPTKCMSRKEQKHRELAHLLAFKESIPDFPDGEITEDKEHPDFQISTSGKTVGIEHTEIFHVSRKNGTTLQAEENYIVQILSKSKKLYDSSNGVPVVVWVNFSIGAHFTKRRIEPIAKVLVSIVESNIPEANGTVEIRSTWKSEDPLPKEISSVTIILYEDRKQSGWAPIGLGGAVPEIPHEFVQKRITRKNEKVDEYRLRCDEIWLLIVVYGFFPSTWFDVSGSALEEFYVSDFDRTYLFDFQNTKAFRLSSKTQK
jgi:hypothetical protein